MTEGLAHTVLLYREVLSEELTTSPWIMHIRFDACMQWSSCEGFLSPRSAVSGAFAG